LCYICVISVLIRGVTISNKLAAAVCVYDAVCCLLSTCSITVYVVSTFWLLQDCFIMACYLLLDDTTALYLFNWPHYNPFEEVHGRFGLVL